MNKIKCPACGMAITSPSGFCRMCGEWVNGAKDDIALASQTITGGKDKPRTYEYEYDSIGNPIREILRCGGHMEWSEFTYDNNGNRVREALFEKDAEDPSEWVEYEYDEKGNRAKEVWYDESGDATSQIEYKYDSQGRLTQQIWYDEDGSVDEWTEYEYDKNGNLTSQIRYEDGNVKFQIETIYGDSGLPLKEVCYLGDFSLSWQSEYDEKGNRIRTMGYDTDGRPDGHTEDRYDERGYLVERLSYNSDGSLSFRVEYRYDNK